MEKPQKSNSFLPMALVLLFIVGISFLLVLATGGFFLYIIAAVVGIVGFGMIHYYLWGRAMMQEVEKAKAEQAYQKLNEASSQDRRESNIRDSR